jgi:pyrimidine-specific ribonucleoside hydrolase
MNKLHLDIETGDPDDLWTLALMSTHPKVDLQGVTVYPGGRDQIGLVKKVLQLVGRDDIPVGANVRDDGKFRVGRFYTNWLGKIDPADPDDDLLGVFKKTKGGNLLTGGPLSNIKVMADSSLPDNIFYYSVDSSTDAEKIFDRWTCQGGFVGDNVLPPYLVLEKFKGKDAVPTFNLNGNPKAALQLLARSRGFNQISMVGKNVCHGFIFDKDDVAKIPKGKHAGLDLMIQGMEFYCKKKPQGKPMHDILAALLHIAPEHGKWIGGCPFRKKGMWGFNAFNTDTETNIRALVSVDRDAIIEELA